MSESISHFEKKIIISHKEFSLEWALKKRKKRDPSVLCSRKDICLDTTDYRLNIFKADALGP